MEDSNKLDRLDIRIGFNCNNNCVYCIVKEGRNKFKDISTDEIKKHIDYAKKEGVKKLTFTGGEPTIRSDFLEIGKYASSLGFEEIMITTNGRLLAYEDYVDKLIDAGFNKFMISLPGHNSELYSEITKTDGFNQVIKGIQNLQKRNQLICLNLVLNKLNYEHLEGYLDLLSRIGFIDLFQVTYVMSSNGDLKLQRTIIPKYSDSMPPFIEFLNGLDKLKNINFYLLMDFPLCFIKNHLKHVNEFRIPNLKIITPNKEFNSDNYNEKRQNCKFKPESCKECDLDNLCEGIWPIYNQLYGTSELIPVKK